ncbi:MAG: low temperature requirement protein A [bacterium]|nr:low temperature requirement protein A [bacterium]
MGLGRFRTFWQPPRTHGEVVEGRSVSFLELFYDLVYVVLIARLASTLAHHISWRSVGEFAVLFAMVWIGWFNGTTYHDAHGRGDARTRMFTFAQMFATAAMAVFAGTAAGSGGTGFAASYTIFLAVLVWLWWAMARMERDDERFGSISRSYAIAMTVMTLWIGASIFVSDTGRRWMWAAFVVAFLAMGVIVGRIITRMMEAEDIDVGTLDEFDPTPPDSLRERFGLFTIIVLGEVIVGVVEGLSEVDPLTWVVGVTGFLGLAVALSLWWTYFDMVGMRKPLVTMTAGMNWRLLHLPLVASIAAAGAAMVSLIGHGADRSAPVDAAWLLGGSVAIAVLSMAALMRQLADYERFVDVYRPVVRLAVVIALAALGIAALQPRPIIIVILLFALMTVQWTVGVYRWTSTEEGIAYVAGDHV